MSTFSYRYRPPANGEPEDAGEIPIRGDYARMCVSCWQTKEPDWNIDDLTDTEIYAAIRYLERDSENAGEQDSDDYDRDHGVVICVCLYVALSVCLAFFWFYWG